ncbi:hypothetical protein ATB99_16665 [Elizabethkingia meningoseptica]|uniref:tetratricopeptide repeat protein n=1 Tax=Elizabethkingia meningoseptica TaxID=238 RepID=UPI000332C5BA|nr:tetratricopeptide repeat protein [Elizabethkingia meningoseptica]AQX06176.1 hypothetical protein BBD33_13345 [Elizabethkingia meningoseptica]AQX48223.1 hypothetical protein B5G46_13340 [Elizabethkingia meningoseptica]EOR28911.1 hypothetical protein L100_13864 [Elizabethkingia meningoseptica ATCC 13253 = NBRC 12535]KUY23409.1 hypothetical protein ATB99_16665 [Elizabethkingia meningoseptica]OPB71557.1 hypothetical protein BAY30_03015 [Elizabethkingia meningoseptica]
MTKTVFFTFFFLYMFTYAQKEKEIDSLYNTVKNYKNLYAENKTEEVLRTCTEVYYKSKEMNYVKGQINALVQMAEIYSNLGNTKMALEKTNEGLSLINENKSYALEWSTLLLTKGRVLSKLGYFDKAMSNFRQSLEIADKIPENKSDNKHHNKIMVYFFIPFSYERDRKAVMNRKDKEFYIQKAYKEAQLISNNYPKKEYLITKSLQGLISAYTDWRELDKADQYLAQANRINKNNTSDWPLTYNMLSGAIEKKRKNYHNAIEYYTHALHLSKSNKQIYDQEHIYALLAECYNEVEDYKNVSYYLYKNKKLRDSLELAEKNATNDVLKNEIKNKSNSEKSFFSSEKFPYTIIVILLLIITAYISVRSINSKRNKQQLLEYSDTAQDQLFINKNNTDSEQLAHIMELAQNNDPTFYFKFEEIFPSFTQNLLNVNSKLTRSDLIHCAMIKLNFDAKKIATIKKASIGAVESKKYRIKKKLNITPEESIYNWMINK